MVDSLHGKSNFEFFPGQIKRKSKNKCVSGNDANLFTDSKDDDIDNEKFGSAHAKDCELNHNIVSQKQRRQLNQGQIIDSNTLSHESKLGMVWDFKWLKKLENLVSWFEKIKQPTSNSDFESVNTESKSSKYHGK